MARTRTKLPELPGCTPAPLRYKETPLVNGNDQPLVLCDRCKGDGHVCTAEKKSFDKSGAATFEYLKDFAGIYRKQRERGGVDGNVSHLFRLQGCGPHLQGECR